MANLAYGARSRSFRIPLRVSPAVVVTYLLCDALAWRRGDPPRVAEEHSWFASQVLEQAQGGSYA